MSKKYKAINSRKYKRLRADYLMKYQPLNSQEPPVIANLKDISAGGLRFWSSTLVPEGVHLRLSVLIPPLDRTVEAVGRVQRVRAAVKSRAYYISVGFVELDSEDQKAINQFVEQISREQGAETLVHHPEVVTRFAIS